MHGKQNGCPGSIWYSPRSHGLQIDPAEPFSWLMYPAGQFRHGFDKSEVLYVPIGQLKQDVVPDIDI
jgi:hypothetical protein